VTLRKHRFLRRLVAPIGLLAAFASTVHAADIDYIREGRWAQEILPSLVVGDAVYLATPARARVLALLTEAPPPAQDAVVIVHGLGVHPDWGVNGALRANLADAGFTTLAVQMPVLAAGASRDDYAVTLPEAGERIDAAIAYLRGRGARKVALVAHSYGATMVDAYLARPNAQPIDAWVPIGMLVRFSAAPKEPVLDVVAERDSREVKAAVRLRKSALPADRCSRTLTFAGADHYFETSARALAEAIAAFLAQAFAGRC
jgi:alpha/beta superfamily hydrolase